VTPPNTENTAAESELRQDLCHAAVIGSLLPLPLLLLCRSAVANPGGWDMSHFQSENGIRGGVKRSVAMITGTMVTSKFVRAVIRTSAQIGRRESKIKLIRYIESRRKSSNRKFHDQPFIAFIVMPTLFYIVLGLYIGTRTIWSCRTHPIYIYIYIYIYI